MNTSSFFYDVRILHFHLNSTLWYLQHNVWSVLGCPGEAWCSAVAWLHWSTHNMSAGHWWYTSNNSCWMGLKKEIVLPTSLSKYLLCSHTWGATLAVLFPWRPAPINSSTAVRPLKMTSFTDTPSYEQPIRDSDRLFSFIKWRMDSVKKIRQI